MANRSLSFIGANANQQRKDGAQYSAGGDKRGGISQSREFTGQGGLNPSGDSVTDLNEIVTSARELTQNEIKVLMDQRALKFKDYGPTKIKIGINMNAYFHHFAHPINIMIRDYNDFVRLVFKAMTRQDRVPKVSDVTYALKLARRLGLQLNKNHLSVQFLKVRENANAVKEKLIQFICKVMQKENDKGPEED